MEAALLLVEAGADLDAADGLGLMPLHAAAQQGDTDMFDLLLDQGQDVNVVVSRPTRGGTMLFNSGAGMSAATGGTPLHLAAGCRHFGATQLLLEAGADVQAADSQGCVPLHAAAEQGDTSVLQLLLDHGADVCAATVRGRTALHLLPNGATQQRCGCWWLVVQTWRQGTARVMHPCTWQPSGGTRMPICFWLSRTPTLRCLQPQAQAPLLCTWLQSGATQQQHSA